MSNGSSRRTSYLVILRNPAGRTLTIRVKAYSPDDAAMRAEAKMHQMCRIHGDVSPRGPWVTLTALKISGTPS